MPGGDILNRTGQEGSVVLRHDTIKTHREQALKQHHEDNKDLRVRKAGAFKRLEPTRHLPITQQDLNDNNWDATMDRIGKVVQRQSEVKASHCPPRDKYKYFGGMPSSSNVIYPWVGTRQMNPEEHPFYGSTYKMEIGGEVPYVVTQDIASPKHETAAQTK
mmetsp:Transcript_15542/g.38497  ORF Transcript_15542/g.38497 Transcript_15542/m.38497 type:complete len:161 (-) Transcript_15542:743-1225(-)